MIKRKKRTVSLWVEWIETENAESLADMLARKGVHGVEIDRDVDIEFFSSPRIEREHTVLRIRIRRDFSISQLLTEIALFPDVFSVGEL